MAPSAAVPKRTLNQPPALIPENAVPCLASVMECGDVADIIARFVVVVAIDRDGVKWDRSFAGVRASHAFVCCMCSVGPTTRPVVAQVCRAALQLAVGALRSKQSWVGTLPFGCMSHYVITARDFDSINAVALDRRERGPARTGGLDYGTPTWRCSDGGTDGRDEYGSFLGYVPVTGNALHSLRATNWVNDDAINGWLILLEKCLRKNGVSDVCMLNTLLHDKFMRDGVPGVTRWFRKYRKRRIKLSRFGMLRHLGGNHWTAVYVELVDCMVDGRPRLNVNAEVVDGLDTSNSGSPDERYMPFLNLFYELLQCEWRDHGREGFLHAEPLALNARQRVPRATTQLCVRRHM